MKVRAIALILLAALMLAGCGAEPAEPTVSAFAPQTSPPAKEGEDDDGASNRHDQGESWAIYWYLCGSDLERKWDCATNDLIEMAQVGLPDNVTVVVQTGGATEWKNDVVDETAHYRLEYGSAGISVVQTLDPSSMGDPGTLSSFLDFCLENYPADNTGLIFWNHGGGSGGGICYDEQFDMDALTLDEVYEALESSCGGYGEGSVFDFIGFDACLMASVDTAAICAGWADYMVASEETEPGCGWRYDSILAALADGADALELCRAICDSYYAGCEAEGSEDMATLSVIDLAQIGDVVESLDSLGLEGLLSVFSGDAAGFYADYGRGASKAEFYSDGGSGMVDLVSLVSANEHLFPESADAIRQSVEACVVYQVTGPYRTGSHGLSMYYPYTMDEEQYEVFNLAAASPALRCMYELLLTGELSDTSWEYLEWLDEAPEDGDVEFADVSEFELEDCPVTIVEEYGDTYAQIDIGPEAASMLERVTFMLARFLDDDETVVLLGEEFDLDCDWEYGIFTDAFRGVWGSIDGNLVMMEVMSVTDEYILYNIPILLNGEDYILSAAYVFESGTYELLTASPDSEGTGAAPKEARQLSPGDEITALFYYLGNDGEGFYEDATFLVTEDTSFGEAELDDGIYCMLFVMTDYRGEVYMSELAGISIEDGYIDVFAAG